MLNTPIFNKKITNTSIKVLQPNGTSMVSTHTCKPLLALLSPTTHKGYVIPSLKPGALLSLG